MGMREVLGSPPGLVFDLLELEQRSHRREEE